MLAAFCSASLSAGFVTSTGSQYSGSTTSHTTSTAPAPSPSGAAAAELMRGAGAAWTRATRPTCEVRRIASEGRACHAPAWGAWPRQTRAAVTLMTLRILPT